jgi:hypothetical protein
MEARLCLCSALTDRRAFIWVVQSMIGRLYEDAAVAAPPGFNAVRLTHFQPYAIDIYT